MDNMVPCQDHSSVALCLPMHTALTEVDNRLLDTTVHYVGKPYIT